MSTRRLLPALPLLFAVLTACGAETAGQDVPGLIALALSAAPPEISATATVVDMEGEVLRSGAGPFTCIAVPDAPMCLDEAWMAWFGAYMAAEPPPAAGLGISYMLAGDAGASNVDPFATGSTPDNQWVVSGPHLMLIVPDPSALDGLPTDPRLGLPYVMWKDTPYAHVMVPVPGRASGGGL